MGSKTILYTGTGIVFILSVILYIICLDPGASLWDCPEYILGAYRLEVGHPPGNPTWLLIAGLVSRMAPTAAHVALFINLTSAVATALAAALLYQIIFFTLRYALFRKASHTSCLLSGLSALAGSLCFAWCDSVIFSAVEAEVYAISIFFTALMVWLMIKWGQAVYSRREDKARKLIILIAYIGGLSIGVHELNLLTLTAMALIYVFVRNRRPSTWKAWMGVVASFILIGVTLLFLIPAIIYSCGLTELLFVNTFHLPYNSGVIAFVVVLFAVFATLPFVGAGIFRSVKVASGLWCLFFFLVGCSTYFLIPIRAAANPPINNGMVSNPFSFYSYFKREQYGSKPLFYGPTPYSSILRKETVEADGTHNYSKYYLKRGRPFYGPLREGAVVSNRNGSISAEDSLSNIKAAERGSGYLKYGNRLEYAYVPEQNMWFPRMTSRDSLDIKSYGQWAGMWPEDMVEIEASYAVDSLGNAVGRFNGLTGEREKEKALRPSYWQQFRYMVAYQIGYMYFRYLLWNFSGRQNNVPSTGEIEHGNFITGIPPIDNMMLGDQYLLPAELHEANRGYNRYFMLPFVVGVFGAVAFCFRGKRCRRANAVVLALFLMTGLAIVFYLNQDPGEARERDYAFIGSFMAFCIWISFGISLILKSLMRKIYRPQRLRRIAAVSASVAVSIALPALILSQTCNDHYRGGRSTAEDVARNVLESLDENAILFADGDNLLFPLWYAQEVLGVRKDVTVISPTYLTLPWYPVSLQIPGEQSAPLKMTGTPGRLAYDAFLYVDVASSDTLDATTALEKMYKRLEEEPMSKTMPRIDARWLRISDKTGKDIIIDLTEAAGGRRQLGSSQLMTLDIIASNAASENPRPVYWDSKLNKDFRLGLEDDVVQTLFTYKLGARENDAMAEGFRTVEALRSGGRNERGYYAEPYIADEFRLQRYDCLLLAQRMADAGKLKEARMVLDKALALWPFEVVTPGRRMINDRPLDEARLALELMKKTLPAVSDKAAEEVRQKDLLNYIRNREQEFRNFYDALPPARRSALTSEFLRIVNP